MSTFDPPHRFGAWELDVPQRQLRRHGSVVPLRSRPFDLLTALVGKAGELVSKDELLERAWPGVIVEENNLQVQISVLRKVLGPSAIATVPGFGYRFTLPLMQTPAVASALPDSARVASTLIGREEDITALQALVSRERMVTIVGAGGIGKTRVATAVAETMAPTFDAGVAWVDLTPVTEPSILATHVCASIGIDAGAASTAQQALVQAMRQGRRLVVLDNAEHVADAAAALAAALIAGTSGTQLLATSQAPLHLGAECLFRLDALALPAAGTPIEHAMQHGAVALFVARAQAVDRRLDIEPRQVDTLIDICRRLDGIPLAIELAAARVPLLGLAGLLAQLSERFKLLRGTRRDLPTRQQTLSAVFDWSHHLLSSVEQIVFRRLGVFSGTFTLDQAREVVAEGSLDEWTVLDAIASLVDRSLVQVVPGDVPRYRLLETTHAYALLKLLHAGEHDTVQRASRVYETAGDAALSAGNSAQALSHLSNALELAGKLQDGSIRDERQLDLALKLGPVVQAALGPSHPRSETVFRMAVAHANRREPNVRSFRAVWGYWQFLCMCGRNRDAAPLAEEIVQMATALRDDGLQLEACHAAMTTHDLLGDATAVVENAARIIAVYDRDRHHALAFSFGGHDPGVCALGQGAWGLWLVGKPDQSLAMAARAISLGDSMTDGYSRATGHYYASFVFAACGRHAEFAATADALVTLSQEHGMETLLIEARLIAGRAHFEQGAADAGIVTMRNALAEIEAGGDLAFVLVYVAFLADALLSVGAVDEAQACLRRGLSHAMQGQGVFLPEMHRLLAQGHVMSNQPAQARVALAQACALADVQGAVSLALRAAMTGVRCKLEFDTSTLARRLLAIEGGADTRDVLEANALR